MCPMLKRIRYIVMLFILALTFSESDHLSFAIIFQISSCLAQLDINWFKTTTAHRDNIELLSNGWTDCPEWSPTYNETQDVTLSTILE